MYSPQSSIKLLNTQLTKDNFHQINFTNVQSQLNYFNSLDNLALTGCTFVKKDNVLRVPYNIETLYKYNYVQYQNSNWTNKYFYAFIEDMKWISDRTTEIKIKTDVFQTWLFDFNINESYIDRQHYALDYQNTITDSPAHGQLVEGYSTECPIHGGYLVFCSSDITQDSTSQSVPYSFTVGSFNVPCWVLYYSESQASDMSLALQNINANGYGDRIICAVYVPFLPQLKLTNIPEASQEKKIGLINVATGLAEGATMETIINFNIGNPNITFNNLKTLTYPYAKIVVQDSTTGQSCEYSPEKFESSNIQFKVVGSISETPTYRIIPLNYCGQVEAYNESLTIKCSTSLPTVNSQYAKYFMTNNESNSLKRLSALGDIGMSAVNKNPFGVISPLESMANISAQENQASKLPNQVNNFVDGVMERLMYFNSLKIGLYVMDSDHMQLANNFWDMYGYPVHTMGIPNLLSSRNNRYNYVKLVSPNITGGNIPQDDMQEIETIFSQGVTLWHNPSNFRIY